MVRRLKKDVLDQLPDKRRQQIEIQVDQKLLKEINKIMMAVSAGVNNLDDLNNDGPMSAMQKMMKFKSGEAGNFDEYLDNEQKKDSGIGSFMTAYRLTGEAKVKGVCEFMETLAENGAKFLVFAHH